MKKVILACSTVFLIAVGMILSQVQAQPQQAQPQQAQPQQAQTQSSQAVADEIFLSMKVCANDPRNCIVLTHASNPMPLKKCIQELEATEAHVRTGKWADGDTIVGYATCENREGVLAVKKFSFVHRAGQEAKN